MGRSVRCEASVRVGLTLTLLLGGCGNAAVPSPAADGAASPAPAGASAAAGAEVVDAAFPGTVLLGAPTDTSVVVSISATEPIEIYIEHGPAVGDYTTRTSTVQLDGSVPSEVTLIGLQPDATSFYRVRHRAIGGAGFLAGPVASFHTQRSAAGTFHFAVEADPHVGFDDKASPDLFRQTLANVRDAAPDFLIDLGDTFMGDKVAHTATPLDEVYSGLRDTFAISGSSVPLFLVNGNHEGESGWSLADGPGSLAALAASARGTYYPNPDPVGFYAGGASASAEGLRDSSYAWEWGDALFVVLDPYSATQTKPGPTGDLWAWTLGETQYRWLTEILRSSHSTYKFVFSHHLIGDVRGGVEQAGMYEWGGLGSDGVDAFDARRPGWGLPVHDLFVRYGVTMFLQGHDHLYLRQELDGVVYQEVPQPATESGDPARMAAEYGYLSGTILGSPGYLDITVAATGVTVDYVHTGTGAGDTSGFANGDIVNSYTIPRPSRAEAAGW